MADGHALPAARGAVDFSSICHLETHKCHAVRHSGSEVAAGALVDGVLSREQCRNVTGHAGLWEQHMRQAGMGRQQTAWDNATARSDWLLWVTPLYDAWLGKADLPDIWQPCSEAAAALAPAFDIFQKAQHTLRTANAHLGLTDRLSIQLARYPANSRGYHEHCDAFSPKVAHESFRQVTLLLYLNDDWQEQHGGELALKNCAPSTVQPQGGRLLAFDAHNVYHSVQPNGDRPRWALTCWLYGTGVFRQAPPLVTPVTLQPSPVLSCDGTATALESIFVNIPAYRDPQTRATVWDLLSTAEHPRRVFIGVVQQLSARLDADGTCEDAHMDVSADLVAVAQNAHAGASGGAGVPLALVHRALRNAMPFMNSEHVRIMTLPCVAAAGPCWARHLGQSLSRGERYSLYLDSHMRMPHKWDNILIRQLQAAELLAAPSNAASAPPQAVQPPSPAVVLSAYPSGFTVDTPSIQTAAGQGATVPPAYTYSVPRVAVSSPMRMALSAAGGNAPSDGAASGCSASGDFRWPRFKGNYCRIPPAYMREAVKLDASGRLREILQGSHPPMPAQWCAAGLSFARTATWRGIERIVRAPALGDPSMRHMFFGEEALMALRIKRAECVVFAPGVPVAWHLWSRAGRAGFRGDSTAATTEAKLAVEVERSMCEAAAREEFLAFAPQCLPELVAANTEAADTREGASAAAAESNTECSIAQRAASCTALSAWELPPQLLMLGGAMSTHCPGAAAAAAAEQDTDTAGTVG